MSNLTYHNDPQLKQLMIKETRWHREQGTLIKGVYDDGNPFNDLDADFNQFKGCAIGCVVLSLKKAGKIPVHFSHIGHSIVAEVLNWPKWLCYLMETIFEGLSDSESSMWPERLATSVPEGKDISKVENRLKIKILERNTKKLEALKGSKGLKVSEISDALDATAMAISALRSNKEDELNLASSMARSSGLAGLERSAEWSSGLAGLARSAEWSLEDSEESIARASAESEEYKKTSDDLIELLEAA